MHPAEAVGGTPRVERFADAQAVAHACADRIAAALATDPAAGILLPAGNTPRPLFDELVRREAARALDLSRARLFQLDEVLGLGPTDPQSFQAFLRRELLERLERPPAAPALLDGSARDPAAAIAEHARRWAALGTPALAVLGLGRNAHVGFCEPDRDPSAPAGVVALAPATRAALGPHATHGMTLGLPDLRRAAELVLLVTGAAKAAVLRAVLDAPPSPALPASLLLDHPGLRVLADRAAAPGR